MHRAIGRSLIAAAVILLCFMEVSYAATAAETSVGKPLILTHISKPRHGIKKSERPHRPERKSAKTSKPTNVVSKEASEDSLNPPLDQSNLPPELANAKAELPPGDIQAKEDSSTLTEADRAAGIETTTSGVQIAAADQLNDMDRELIETSASVTPSQSVALPYSRVISAQASSGQDDAWNRASLIGKIFIGFGAMLTLASAARMLAA